MPPLAETPGFLIPLPTMSGNPIFLPQAAFANPGPGLVETLSPSALFVPAGASDLALIEIVKRQM